MITSDTKKKYDLSFEVFPPKKDGEFDKAFQILDELAALNPEFISVTYGAGGSQSKKTTEIASYIQNQLHIDAVAHMTCVGSKKTDILNVCRELKEANVRYILALRGDRPKDMSDEVYNSREFAHASDLIRFLHETNDFSLVAACYPEKHYECFSMESDLKHLKEKEEAGAKMLISQMFFDNDYFYDFLSKCNRKHITLPVHAGIMPITAAKQLGTSVSLSGCSIPKALSDLIAKYGDDPEDMYKAGIDYAIRQIRDLLENHVEGIHLYTMNKPQVAKEIVAAIR